MLLFHVVATLAANYHYLEQTQILVSQYLNITHCLRKITVAHFLQKHVAGNCLLLEFMPLFYRFLLKKEYSYHKQIAMKHFSAIRNGHPIDKKT